MPNVAIFCFVEDNGGDETIDWWWVRAERELWVASNGPWDNPFDRYAIINVPEDAPAADISDAAYEFGRRVLKDNATRTFRWEERDQ